MGCCSSNLIKDAIVMSKYGLKIYEEYIGYDNFIRFQKQTLDKEVDSLYACVPVVLHIDCKIDPLTIIKDILPDRAYTIDCIRYGQYRIYKVHSVFSSY